MELSQQTYSNFAGMSGHKAAQIIIYSLPGANALDVADEVRQAMAEMSKDFPPGLTYASSLRHHQVCGPDDSRRL